MPRTRWYSGVVVAIGVAILLAPGRSFADPPPAITSTDNAVAVAGSPFSFTMTTVGTPIPSIKEKGKLPKGLTLTNNHDGTASLAGTPNLTTGGVYPRPIGGTYHVTIAATFGAGITKQVLTQSFTLVVDQAPTITSRATTKARVGRSFSFTFKTRGFPKPSMSASGALPSGIVFTDNGNGTATLAGTPGSGSAGTYPVTISASNGVGATAGLNFVVVVRS